MRDYAIVYTLSDKGNMVKDILSSLKTASKYEEKEDIIVFHTPPIKQETVRKLSRYATVIQTSNVTEPFTFVGHRGPGQYGEKVQLCYVDRENVLFLDCDTEIRKDPIELLEGDFDFAGRVSPMGYFDIRNWCKLFRDYGREPIGMFNTGFIIFKNYAHHKIGDKWMFYLNEDLPQLHPYSYHKDQYALSLAVSDLKIRYLRSSEHAFRWLDEEHIETVVMHGTKIKYKYLRKLIKNSPIKNLMPHKELYDPNNWTE